MLRITTDQHGKTSFIKLEGRLGGPWVGELERTWRKTVAASRPSDIVIDISEISFADPDGRKLLERICQQGGTLKARGCMCTDLAERIKRACLEASAGPSGRKAGKG